MNYLNHTTHIMAFVYNLLSRCPRNLFLIGLQSQYQTFIGIKTKTCPVERCSISLDRNNGAVFNWYIHAYV